MAERLAHVPRVRKVESLFPEDGQSYTALRRWAPPTRYTLRRNTASIMKGLVLVWWLSQKKT